MDVPINQTDVTIANIAMVLSTHGDLIVSRWFKKSRDKRSCLLSTAAPFLTTKNGEQGISVPWLQTKDLVEDRTKLIALLHVRTTYSSKEWATFDTIETGSSMFRTQNEIANALIAIINAIVADAAPSGNTKWLALTNNGLYGGGVTLDSYQDAGFAPPINGLDTDALLQTAYQERSRMADEIELLQTDPEYTRDIVLALKADIRWDANVSSSLKWEHIAGRFATDALPELNLWHDIFITCTQLRDACQEHEGATIFRPGASVSQKSAAPWKSFANCSTNTRSSNWKSSISQ